MNELISADLAKFLSRDKGSLPFKTLHFFNHRIQSGLILVTIGDELILYTQCYAKLKQVTTDPMMRTIAMDSPVDSLKIRYRCGEYVTLKTVEKQLIKQYSPKYNMI